MTQGFIKGIDGLRALAVIVVIIYHLNPTLLPGGFTGVDIFFVISGYVVAKSLNSRRGQALGPFITDFYKRRILRIYPALLVCLILTSIIVVLLIPQSYVGRTIEDTALSAFFGVSNFILAFNTDSYFSPGAEFNPFIHTWSLGVEEQFYLIFPFLFYLWMKKTVRYSMHILLLISLTLSYYHTSTDGNHAYYLLTSRFWELAAGAILYKTHQSYVFDQKALKSAILTTVGFIAIIISLAFSDKLHFPFPWAILSVLGTCLLIHSIVQQNHQSPKTLKIFESTLAVHIGKLSYSLYLWHWPTFTLFRWTTGLESVTEITLAILITYTASVISYYTLESKFTHLRIIKNLGSKTVLLGGLSVIFISFFVTKKGFNSQPWRSLSVTTNKHIWSPYSAIPPPSSGLELSGRTIYVLGDSHASAYQKMLARLAEETGASIKLYSKGGCGIGNLISPTLVKTNPCFDKVSNWLKIIKNSASEKDIIFLATLKMYRLADQSSLHPGDPDTVIEYQQGVQAENQRHRALTETLNILEELSMTTQMIVMDAPKPVFNYITFRCADWYSKTNPICERGFVETREFMESFRKPTLDSLHKIKEKIPNVTIWDPLPVLCTDKECSAYDGDFPLYFDADHLSGHGNRLLYPSFKHHILMLTRGFDN
jgi:peptidoglycan/LPS O-acetylase OafA/YrhL